MLKDLMARGMDRRQLLLGGLASSVALSGCSTGLTSPMAASGTAPMNFDPLSKKDNLEAFIKLSGGSLDETVDSPGWFSGRIFSVIGDHEIIRPLFDIEGFGVSRHEKQPDGSYKRYQRECGFYKDLYSGKIIESWKNPLNGKNCEVWHIQNDPVNQHLKEDFPMAFGANEDQSSEMFPFIMPWEFIGDQAFASFDVNIDWKSPLDPAKWPEASPGERVRVSEYQQWSMSLDQLNDRSAPKIYSTGGWHRISNWLPWMRMGQTPGHLFYRSHTKALRDVNELTPQILDYTAKFDAKYFEAPKEWVVPNESSYEVYAEENEPH